MLTNSIKDPLKKKNKYHKDSFLEVKRMM